MSIGHLGDQLVLKLNPTQQKQTTQEYK